MYLKKGNIPSNNSGNKKGNNPSNNSGNSSGNNPTNNSGNNSDSQELLTINSKESPQLTFDLWIMQPMTSHNRGLLD